MIIFFSNTITIDLIVSRYLCLSTYCGNVAVLNMDLLLSNDKAGQATKSQIPFGVVKWLEDPSVVVLSCNDLASLTSAPLNVEVTNAVSTKLLFRTLQDEGCIKTEFDIQSQGDSAAQLSWCYRYHHKPCSPGDLTRLIGQKHQYDKWPETRKALWRPTAREWLHDAFEAFYFFYEGLTPHLFIQHLMLRGITQGGLEDFLDLNAPFATCYVKFVQQIAHLPELPAPPSRVPVPREIDFDGLDFPASSKRKAMLMPQSLMEMSYDAPRTEQTSQASTATTVKKKLLTKWQDSSVVDEKMIKEMSYDAHGTEQPSQACTPTRTKKKRQVAAKSTSKLPYLVRSQKRHAKSRADDDAGTQSRKEKRVRQCQDPLDVSHLLTRGPKCEPSFVHGHQDLRSKLVMLPAEQKSSTGQDIMVSGAINRNRQMLDHASLSAELRTLNAFLPQPVFYRRCQFCSGNNTKYFPALTPSRGKSKAR